MFTAALILLLPPSLAQDPTPVTEIATEQSPEAEFAEIQARFKASKLGYAERMPAFHDEYRAFADRNAGSALGMEAELVLLSSIWYMEESERPDAARKAYDRLIEAYGASEHIVPALEPIAYLIPKKEQDALLQRIAEGSEHDTVQAAVLFYRAKRMKGEERTKALTTLKEKYGKHKLKYSTYEDLANAYLKPHAKADLAIGKVAPEITGVDLNGKPMKLSDFRGKVVVLDFWGDW